MRQIKFRAWDEINNLMHYDDVPEDKIKTHDLVWSIGMMCGSLMQYTGLKDKNGKEIYEGDIVQLPDDWEEYGWMACEKREVFFLDGGFRLKPKPIKPRPHGRGHWIEEGHYLEVIGNIYQNPDLLN